MKKKTQTKKDLIKELHTVRDQRNKLSQVNIMLKNIVRNQDAKGSKAEELRQILKEKETRLHYSARRSEELNTNILRLVDTLEKANGKIFTLDNQYKKSRQSFSDLVANHNGVVTRMIDATIQYREEVFKINQSSIDGLKRLYLHIFNNVSIDDLQNKDEAYNDKRRETIKLYKTSLLEVLEYLDMRKPNETKFVNKLVDEVKFSSDIVKISREGNEEMVDQGI